MEPRFHSGDLAVLRPADEYRVGDIAAYRSKLLNTVVPHRIVDREGDQYVFKGDNNEFLDPTQPRRDELLGKLAVRVPRGGAVLGWLRQPMVAAALASSCTTTATAPTPTWSTTRARCTASAGPDATGPRDGAQPAAGPQARERRAVTRARARACPPVPPG
jgi:hypothetical protein